MTDLPFHPLANCWDFLEGPDFEKLVASIRANGLREPITVYDGMVLDGRNRQRACAAAGVACEYVPYKPRTNALPDYEELWAFVLDKNDVRTHRTIAERAMAAARRANLKEGRPSKTPSTEGVIRISQQQAADQVGVSIASVERARVVVDHGTPELQQAVTREKVSLAVAADIATQPKEVQREIVARGEREILEAARAIRGKKAEERRTGIIERLRRIAEQNIPLPAGGTARRYPIILADPPWEFHVYDETSGLARAAGNHYPSMTIEEICELPVSELATSDAVLFLWTTAPHLGLAFKVIASWGFEYKTNIVWTKDKIGLGYFVRNQHELLLIATRGDIPTPAPANRPASVLKSPRREHSQKPDEVYGLIEQMYPDLPKIELFARTARAGWAAWGNQAPACGGTAGPG
jgi:N6-adenosine-specific RNA methylase IME4